LSNRLVNTLIPGSVKKVNTSTMAFKCMENINNFLAVAVSIGVPSQETFQSVDLWERQNLNSVVICLQSLGRKVKLKIFFTNIVKYLCTIIETLVILLSYYILNYLYEYFFILNMFIIFLHIHILNSLIITYLIN